MKNLTNEPPKAVRDGETLNKIQDIVDRCENPKGGSNPISNQFDLKDFLLERLKLLEKDIQEERELEVSKRRNLLVYFIRG